jgi:hypothetical protein
MFETVTEPIPILIRDLTSDDIRQARDAAVRAMLLLEWDAQGFLDKSASVGFPQQGLYDFRPTSRNVLDLINGIKELLANAKLPEEIQRSILWALSKSNRQEAKAVVNVYQRSESDG